MRAGFRFPQSMPAGTCFLHGPGNLRAVAGEAAKIIPSRVIIPVDMASRVTHIEGMETGDMEMDKDFQDHGTTLETAVKVIIYRDEWVSSRPWHADVEFQDGQKWKGWQSFFRSKKALIQNARAALDTAGMHNAEIVEA